MVNKRKQLKRREKKKTARAIDRVVEEKVKEDAARVKLIADLADLVEEKVKEEAAKVKLIADLEEEVGSLRQAASTSEQEVVASVRRVVQRKKSQPERLFGYQKDSTIFKFTSVDQVVIKGETNSQWKL